MRFGFCFPRPKGLGYRRLPANVAGSHGGDARMGIPSGSRILSERMRSEVQVPEPTLSPKGRATRKRKLAPEGQKKLTFFNHHLSTPTRCQNNTILNPYFYFISIIIYSLIFKPDLQYYLPYQQKHCYNNACYRNYP